MLEHHASDEGLWLEFAKKTSGIPTIGYARAPEVAIAYGWIDELEKGLDAEYYLMRFTPRRARSRWSEINRDIAEARIGEGRMHPSGLVQVEAARAAGRWKTAKKPSRS